MSLVADPVVPNGKRSHTRFEQIAIKPSIGRTKRIPGYSSTGTVGTISSTNSVAGSIAIIAPQKTDTLASVHEDRAARWYRPADSVSVRVSQRTHPTASSSAASVSEEAVVAAIDASHTWNWGLLEGETDEDSIRTAGALVWTQTHFEAMRRWEAGEITREQIPAPYKVTQLSCTCPSRRRPCKHIVGYRHLFLRANQIYLRVTRMREMGQAEGQGRREASITA